MGWVCRNGHPHRPGASCPTGCEWSLPFPVAPARAGTCPEARPGSTGLAGQRDAGMQPSPACSLLRGRRGAGRSRAMPVAWQLPCKSPACQKTFFPAIRMDFTGAGSGLDDRVVLRNHTLYLEGLRIRFGQVPAMQPGTGYKNAGKGFKGSDEASQGSYIPILALLRDHDALHQLHSSKRWGCNGLPLAHLQATHEQGMSHLQEGLM